MKLIVKSLILLCILISPVMAWEPPFRCDDQKTRINFDDLSVRMMDTFTNQTVDGNKILRGNSTFSGNNSFTGTNSFTKTVTISTSAIINELKIGTSIVEQIRANLHLSGGDSASNYSNASIALGYSTTGTFPHFLHTRHNTAPANNAIDFYTSSGVSSGTFPTNAVYCATITNGKLGLNNKTPSKTLDVTGSAAISGYTQLGTNAPNIAVLYFSTKTAGVEGGVTSITHGLTPAKIIFWTGKVIYSPGNGIMPNEAVSAEYIYTLQQTSTQIQVVLQATSSGNIRNKDVLITVWYIE